MANKTFKQQQEEKYRDLADNLKEEMPSYIDGYVRHLRQSATNNSILGYLRDIKTFFTYIVDCYKDTENDVKLETMKDVSLDILSSISSDFIDEYMEYISLYENNGRKVTNTKVSLRRKLSSIKSIYEYLIKSNKISIDPTIKVRTPKPETKKIVRLEDDESTDLINLIETGGNLKKNAKAHHERQKDRDLAIVFVLLTTGIRVSECVGLNTDDINFRNNSLRVSRKGNKQDDVYFSDEAGEILKIYLEQREKIETLEGHEKALFLSNQRRRITVRSVENLVKKYAKIITPNKEISPHKLRSTFGTNLYNATNDIYLVSSRLGHSSIEVAKKYVEAEEQRKRDSRNLVTYRKKINEEI